MTVEDCLFCAMLERRIPADVVAETPTTFAFRDIHPVAPVHVLVIPKAHHPDMAALVGADPGLAGEVMATATAVAVAEGLVESGYRLIANTGVDAGQSVSHVHVHVLGGRSLAWPPG